MKTLILLRHAEANSNDKYAPDHEKCLSKRGEQSVPEMALKLLGQNIAPSLFLSSTATRTVSTAKHIIKALDLSADILKTDARLYLATHSDILKVVEEQENTISELLVIGHNPGLTNLANHLLSNFHLDNLPATGIVIIQSITQSWIEVYQSKSSLFYYDYPQKKGHTSRKTDN